MIKVKVHFTGWRENEREGEVLNTPYECDSPLEVGGGLWRR